MIRLRIWLIWSVVGLFLSSLGCELLNQLGTEGSGDDAMVFGVMSACMAAAILHSFSRAARPTSDPKLTERPS